MPAASAAAAVSAAASAAFSHIAFPVKIKSTFAFAVRANFLYRIRFGKLFKFFTAAFAYEFFKRHCYFSLLVVLTSSSATITVMGAARARTI